MIISIEQFICIVIKNVRADKFGAKRVSIKFKNVLLKRAFSKQNIILFFFFWHNSLANFYRSPNSIRENADGYLFVEFDFKTNRSRTRTVRR